MIKARKSDHIDQIAGSILKDFRKKNGLSQTTLANGAGITFQQVQKYEKGINRISVSKLFAMCEVLNISTTNFIKKVTEALKDEGM